MVITLYAGAAGLHQRILSQEANGPSQRQEAASPRPRPANGHAPQGGPRQPPMLEARPTAQPLCSLGTGTHPFTHWQMHALLTIYLFPECNYTCVHLHTQKALQSLGVDNLIYSCTHILAFCIPKPSVLPHQVPAHHLSHWGSHTACSGPCVLTNLHPAQCLETRNSLLPEMATRIISHCKTGSLLTMV